MTDDPIFSGVRIVELAGGIAGPYATCMLGDHGADVVKVESADGDPYRGDPGFHALNRNKRSVVVDDPTPLVATADVVVTDVAGDAARWRQAAPGAVIIDMAPWGSRGERAGTPATDGMVAAATGIGWNQASYGEGPIDVVLPLASYGSGLLGALAIAAGLYARAAHSSAPTYEVSLVAGAGAMQCGDFWIPELPRERDGSAPLGSNGRMPVYRPLECADGRWLFLACGTTRFYDAMVDAIERPDLHDDPLLADPPWGLLDLDALAHITPTIEDVFRSRSRDEWLEVLRAHDVPCQPIQTRDEFVDSRLARDNDILVDVEHPDLGTVSVGGPPLRLEAAPGAVRTAAPGLGEHTAEVLAEDHEPVDGEGQGGPPLAGVTAIDLSSFIAGPVITRHLAMLGAEVVKVEPPAGDAFRVMPYPFLNWNQGKKGIVLDLTTDEGRGALRRLAEAADVVVENFRPGVAARLGCDQSTLRDANTDLVLVSSPGYGACESMADQPAFDPLLQALGGSMAAQGGAADPVFLTVPLHDVATPLIAAFGTVSALYDRARTGRTQMVRTSLAQTAGAVQAAELVRHEGRPSPRVGGFDHRGEPGATYVEDDDGWWWEQDGTRTAVETGGFVWAQCAIDNDLVVEQVDPAVGPVRLGGQYIGGAGPAPERAPTLGEHDDEIATRFGLS